MDPICVYIYIYIFPGIGPRVCILWQTCLPPTKKRGKVLLDQGFTEGATNAENSINLRQAVNVFNQRQMLGLQMMIYIMHEIHFPVTICGGKVHQLQRSVYFIIVEEELYNTNKMGTNKIVT